MKDLGKASSQNRVRDCFAFLDIEKYGKIDVEVFAR